MGSEEEIVPVELSADVPENPLTVEVRLFAGFVFLLCISFMYGCWSEFWLLLLLTQEPFLFPQDYERALRAYRRRLAAAQQTAVICRQRRSEAERRLREAQQQVDEQTILHRKQMEKMTCVYSMLFRHFFSFVNYRSC
jgi:hypothetical protein